MRTQALEAEQRVLPTRLAELEGAAGARGVDTSKEVRELEQRGRTAKSELEALYADYERKTRAISSADGVRARLEAEYMPYEREQLIQAHKQTRAALVARARECAQLLAQGVDQEGRLRVIERAIGPRPDPYAYTAKASVHRGELIGFDHYANSLESGAERPALASL